MSTAGKLQAKLAELLQINEAAVTHIESLVAERDYFKNGMAELQDIIDKLEPERDALAVENIELRQRKLIHIGFTNESQVQYVTEDKEEGTFYPNSDHGCYIPIYMLNVHAHRVGPDSKIYCTHLEQGKKIAEIRAEAGRAGFIAGAEMWSDYGAKSRYKDDYLVDIEADASKYAEKVRSGK